MATPNTRRSTFVTFVLMALLSVVLAGFLYIVGGPIFLSMLAAVAVFAALGAAHYFLWGRADQHRVHNEVRATPRDRLPPGDYRA